MDDSADDRASTLPLRSLLTSCVHLSLEAGRAIRDVQSSGALGARSKEGGSSTPAHLLSSSEVLTEADARAHEILAGGLRGLHPAIRVVSEEDKPGRCLPVAHGTACGALATTLDRALLGWLEGINLCLPNSPETCVWIDPLDGTKDFTRGNLAPVTVLVGISVGGERGYH